MALEGLRKSTRSAEEAVKSKQKNIKDIDKEIKEARLSPEVVEGLLTERANIQQRITVLDAELTKGEKRQNLLTRVIDGRDHRTNLENALAALADLSVVSPEWLTLVNNSAEISDLVSRIVSGSRLVDGAHTTFVTAAAVIGMDVTRLEGVTLSAPERLQITTVTTTLLQSRDNVASTRTELNELDVRRTEVQTSASNLARTIGLDEDALARLKILETQLPDLVTRAVRWREDNDKAIEADAQVAGNQASWGCQRYGHPTIADSCLQPESDGTGGSGSRRIERGSLGCRHRRGYCCGWFLSVRSLEFFNVGSGVGH